MTSPAERAWRRLPDGARQVLEDELSASDLQSLLLDLSRTRAGRVTASGLRQRWASDYFVRPATADPARLASVAAELWRLLPDDVARVALSPVTPLGTSAALGTVDQHRVLSTVRAAEVVSDPTNVLALEAALRRDRGAEEVHLAAVHRVLRHQRFDAPAQPHFELFALTSSSRDTGNLDTELALLRTHLGFWSDALDAVLGRERWFVAWTVVDHRRRSRWQRFFDQTAVPHREDPQRTQGIGYYATLAFKIMIEAESDPLEIGDGGFTDWTAQLRADAKERCLISCVATERLATAAD